MKSTEALERWKTDKREGKSLKMYRKIFITGITEEIIRGLMVQKVSKTLINR